MPETTHPLPRSRSVVVEVTKIVDVARPEVVVVDHVKLAVAVLPREATPSRSHGFRSYRDETSVPCQSMSDTRARSDDEGRAGVAPRQVVDITDPTLSTGTAQQSVLLHT